MAYQKLQAGKAWSVNRSDNTVIPDVGLGVATGTTTSGSATQLIDAGRVGTDTANQATLNFITAGVRAGAGDDVTFQGINTGAFFPVHVKKVWLTGTTASNIIALW